MTAGPDGTVEEYFQFKPSLALSLIGLLLFLLITVVIAVQTYRHRAKFMWIVVFTGGLEIAGYISHLIAAEVYDDSAYIAYLVFTILAPNFLALANYVAVGKVAQELQLSGRFLNAKVIATAFFIVDLICIGIQGGGSAILSSALDDNDNSKTSSGQTVVLIGLAIQLFFFASFSLVAAYVYRLQQTKSTRRVPNQVYVCLLVTIALITLRNIYRVVEMAAGWDGKYNSNELYFYCLDALPIFIAFCIYSLLHFGRYLQPAAPTASKADLTNTVRGCAPSSANNQELAGAASRIGTVKAILTLGQKKKQQPDSNGEVLRFQELV